MESKRNEKARKNKDSVYVCERCGNALELNEEENRERYITVVCVVCGYRNYIFLTARPARSS